MFVFVYDFSAVFLKGVSCTSSLNIILSGEVVSGKEPGIAVLLQYEITICWSNADIENYSFACWIFLYFSQMYHFLDGKITDFD